MDDTNRILDQNQTNAQAQPQAQPLSGQTQAPIQQPQGGSVGSLVKEHGPVAADGLRPSGPEPEIHPELEQIGVKLVSEFPEVKPEHMALGIEPAKESVPVQTVPSGHVQIPMTEEEARETLKDAKPSESRWGLAAEVLKFFKMIHHGLIKSSKLKV